MKISTRLTLGFSAMAALIVLLGLLAIFKVTGIQRSFSNVMDERYPNTLIANEIKSTNTMVAQALVNLFIVTDPADVKALFDTIAGAGPQTAANIDKLKKSMVTPKEQEALQRFIDARTDYRKPRDRILEMIKAGKLDEAKVAMVGELRAKQVVYQTRVEELLATQNDLMRDTGAEVAANVTSTEYTVAVLIAVACGLAGLLAVWTIRATVKPINDAVAIAREVAAGNLAVEFKADGRSETGLLLGALHDMKTRLSAIVSNVRQNAETVATASTEIAQGNNELSSRTEQQASALQETAASMEQLSSTVSQNADNARQANQLALDASGVAVEGGSVVSQVVDTMKGINESSRRIVDIISVIDGIAFQTNILALNAAVEAARAGEQGRGFAVVASEVRSLAQRSAEAAKEIKALISASVERVEQGTTLVDRAGVTMQEVVASIRRVTDIMSEISSASSEQSSGVTQVGQAVTQMDQNTQQNAALVEESAAAAESLKVQARQLVETVEVFKLAAVPA
jgi:methyl-accepting chemotaxis protein